MTQGLEPAKRNVELTGLNGGLCTEEDKTGTEQREWTLVIDFEQLLCVV